jgi:antitoxin component of RelBE/YafQ-DinJ toxin-antitoxin module
MSLLQVQVDDQLKNTLKSQAQRFGISVSALVRITLIQQFQSDFMPGNVFNSKRDNEGKGVPLDDLI